MHNNQTSDLLGARRCASQRCAASYVAFGSKPEKLNASICFPLCPPKADIAQCSRHVSNVPTTDSQSSLILLGRRAFQTKEA